MKYGQSKTTETETAKTLENPNEGGVDILLKDLRKRYRHGHPAFVDATLDELSLHSRKNKDYAGGGDPLGNFRRVAAILSQYPGLDLSQPSTIALIFALKQVDAIFWALCRKEELSVESVDDKLRDVSVYYKLARIMLEEEGVLGGSDPLPQELQRVDKEYQKKLAQVEGELGRITKGLLI